MHDILDDIFIYYTTKSGEKVFLDFNLDRIIDERTKNIFERLQKSYFNLDLKDFISPSSILVEGGKNADLNCYELFNNIEFNNFYIKDVLYIDTTRRIHVKMSTKFSSIRLLDLPEKMVIDITTKLPDCFLPIGRNEKSQDDSFSLLRINRDAVVTKSIKVESMPHYKNFKFLSFNFKPELNKKSSFRIECLDKYAQAFKDYDRIKNKKNLLKACSQDIK